VTWQICKSLSIKGLRERPGGGLPKSLMVSYLVLAKTFVAEPPAVLVDVAREVMLLQLAGVDPVAVVSLNGRDDDVVLRVEPIYVSCFRMSHN
ncbi:uncharacterized protein METZ01_LOCUS423112, partial [marine metagenome]